MIDLLPDLARFCVSCVSGYDNLPLGLGLLGGVFGMAAGVFAAGGAASAGASGAAAGGNAGGSDAGGSAGGSDAGGDSGAGSGSADGTSSGASSGSSTGGASDSLGARIDDGPNGVSLSYPNGDMSWGLDDGGASEMTQDTGYTWNADGTLGYHRGPDGVKTFYDEHGNVASQFRDGSIVRAHPGSADAPAGPPPGTLPTDPASPVDGTPAQPGPPEHPDLDHRPAHTPPPKPPRLRHR